MVPRRQDKRFHEVEVVIVTGGFGGGGGGGGVGVAPHQAGLEVASAHHHGVQDNDLVPRHIDVQALMGTRRNVNWFQIQCTYIHQ